MENYFEQKRSGANCVAQVDMFCLIFQTLIAIAVFVFAVGLLNHRYNGSSDGVLITIVLAAVIISMVIAVDFYAIHGLLKASIENNNVNAEKALSRSQFWYNLSILLLIIGILCQLVSFRVQNLVALAIGVPIRVYMLGTVKNYMEALKERVMETGANTIAITVLSAPEENEFDDNLV